MNVEFNKQYLQQPHGYADFGHREALVQNKVLDVIRKHYELAGFTPIDTPMVERPEVLAAKSSGQISKQIYGLRLMNPSDATGDDSKDLCIRFDLTVPLARHVAANQHLISFPFRRHQIGYVMRGEHAKKGRYRSFIQADIDVIGDGELNLFHDAECIATAVNIFKELNFGAFHVHINNRKILKGLFASYGLNTDEDQRTAMDAIDDLYKVGRDAVIQQLSLLGLSHDAANQLLGLLSGKLPVAEMFEQLRACSVENSLLETGVSELQKVVSALSAMGISENYFCINLCIARGLDYYTGTVYETFLDDHTSIGSIASGGRYDDLASVYTNRNLPGVGVSIGVTRLVYKLLEAGLIDDGEIKTVAPVLLTTQNIDRNSSHILKLASSLRQHNIGVEAHFAERKLGKQLQFANKRGFRIALICDDGECDNGQVIVRDLKTGNQQLIAIEGLVTLVQELLA